MFSKTNHIKFTALFLSLLLLVPAVSFAQSANWFETGLWNLVVGLFGRLAGLAGLALDWGITEYVVGFGKNFTDTGIGSSVDILWVSVRDIFNITFIFGLVFIGFKMILSSDDPSTRRWLVSLIMAAILVNFSLLITKTVVDFSNIVATQIAQGFPLDKSGDISVSFGFMDTFGIQGILNQGDTSNFPNNVPSGGAAYAYIFGTMILLIVTTFVFAAGAIMLFIRYAALCLFMVLSPLMFLSWVFPQMSSITGKYWQAFLGRAFFAPVYLLLIYFSTYILKAWMNIVTVNGKRPNYADTFAGTGNTTLRSFDDTLPPFILATIFMLASVVIANKMGSDGASTMINFGKNLQGRAQRGLQRAAWSSARMAGKTAYYGSGAGTAVWGAKQVGGRTMRSISHATGTQIDNLVSKMQRGEYGKSARSIGNWTITDDFRQGASKKLKGAKFGLDYTHDEAGARQEAILNHTQTHDTVSAGLAARQSLQTYEQRQKQIATAEERLQKETFVGDEGAKQKTELEQQVKTLREQQTADGFDEETVKKLNVAVATMQGTVGSLGAEQLERVFNQTPEQFKAIVGDLKGSQFDALANSKNLNQEQKSNLKQVRLDALSEMVKENGQVSMKALEALSTKQLEDLGDEFIRENAHLLTQKQMDDIIKSDKFTEGQRGAYLGNRKNQMIEAFKGPQLAEFFKNRKPAEIAAVPFEAYINNPEAINKLESKHMDELYKKLDPAQRDQLRDAILSGQNSSAKQYITTNFNAARNWNTVGNNTGSNQSQGSQNSGNPIVDQNGNPITR